MKIIKRRKGIVEMILVAYSNKDVAGINIAKQFLKHFSFTETEQTHQGNPIFFAKMNGKEVKLVTLKDEAVYSQDLLSHFEKAEFVVFLSRHSSQSGKPTLSVHVPGNFGNAELGGLGRTVSVAPAVAMRDALKALFRFKLERDLDYEISYECTHHGPSLDKPTMFIELGSSKDQWHDDVAAEVVAKAAWVTIQNFGLARQTAVLGVGGPHYNQRFTEMALDNKTAFGHMIPKYAISLLDAEIVQHCVERTLEKVTGALIDWKGVKGVDKERLLELLRAISLPFEKV